MKKIYTVMITEDEGPDFPTTVSFLRFEDAVTYCLEEIQNAGDVSDVDLDMIQEELLDQGYYEDYGTTYYIEEANLM